ncbi:MAG TPA: ABC-2 family transporter protein [Acidimicrobiales bacterium]|jgi:ABC-2 type transport system permease protein|nr:ABC-2 family transporter protein [Acidimicrobiales bacterium]
MKTMVATSRSAFFEAWGNRAGFWTQVLTMVANDIAWVVFWVLFFREIGELRGWDTSRVLMLQAMLTVAGGIVLGFFYNARAIGRMAVGGELDAALALPVSPLSYLLVRRVNTTNLGDIAFGVVLFAIAGNPNPERIAIFVVGVVTAVVTLTGFLVAIGSLAFWAGRTDAGDLGFQAMLVFASYPVDVFGGAARMFLFTVIPAAFVAAVPARLVDDFDLGVAATCLAAAAVFAALGWVMFHAGLKRYTSGAVWTRA